MPELIMMFSNSMTMLGRGTIGAPTFYWPLHCGIVLALSLLVLLVSVVSVRTVALRQATGQLGTSLRKHRPRKSADRASIGRQDCPAPAIRVVGPPVIWKELKSPMLGRRKRLAFLAVGLALILILGSYYFCAVQHILDDPDTHIIYAIVYMDTNPFVHAVVSIGATAGKSAPSRYWWAGSRGGDVFGATLWMLSCMAGYVFFGAVLAWRAQSRFRRDIF